MKLRCSLIAFTLLLTACNISVTSFPSEPGQPAPAVPPTELAPTPSPETPAPAAIDAPLVDSPALIEIQFLNELDGWGVTETQIVRTNDGGVTWYNVTPPAVDETGFSVAMFVSDNEHVWLQKPDYNNFPNGGTLYSTRDGGITWT